MRRLARHAFTTLAALSLLLCVAVCVLWVRSYFRSDSIGYGWPDTAQHWVRACRGELGYHWMRVTQPCPFKVTDNDGWFAESEPDALPWKARIEALDGTCLFGFGHVERHAPTSWGTASQGIVTMPLWSVAILTGLLPVVSIVRHARTAKRARRGLCPACGYDLRASPGRCPECGADGPRAAV